MKTTAFAACILFLAAALAPAQKGPLWLPHVPFVTTSPEVSRAMLELAGVKPTDVVYDLGCGDGRIVVMAARKFGARGTGIDIDPERIKEANENARLAGVGDKVRFVQADLFYADFHDATVVSMFLLPSVNVKLRPKLFHDLKPGTRIVTHNFDIGDWKPERQIIVDGVPVYLWTIPRTTNATGRVLMEDETPPPISASIEKVCGGRAGFEGYTDAEGHFSVALEGTLTDSHGCRIRASLPGYRSDAVELRDNSGTIVLHRSTKSEGTLISASTKTAPDAAKEEFVKGRMALGQGRQEAALNAFTRVLELHPGFTAALFELGAIHETQGRMDSSTELYRKAIALEPNYLSPYLGLVQVAMHEDRWGDVARYAEDIIRLDPENFPDAYLSHAIGNLTLRKLEAAEKSARTAMRLDTEHQFPRAEYVLGLALAAQGDIAAAQRHLAHYIEADPKAPDRKLIEERLAVLQKTNAAH